MTEIISCRWCLGDALLQKYHDEEWGMVQLHDDSLQFEFLTMEVMQCGLSWMTVLKKRETMRTVFDGFDYRAITKYDDAKISSLLSAPGIIHSEAKIRAMVNNAARFMEIQAQFGSFSAYFWRFTDRKTLIMPSNRENMPSKTPLSERISKDLKKRGFQFLGPVVMYSHMQAAGMVNDHEQSCFGFQLLGGEIIDE